MFKQFYINKIVDLTLKIKPFLLKSQVIIVKPKQLIICDRDTLEVSFIINLKWAGLRGELIKNSMIYSPDQTKSLRSLLKKFKLIDDRLALIPGGYIILRGDAAETYLKIVKKKQDKLDKKSESNVIEFKPDFLN